MNRPKFRRTVRRNRALISAASIVAIILIVVTYSFAAYGSLTPEPKPINGSLNTLSTGKNQSAAYMTMILNISSPQVLAHPANLKITVGSAPAAVLTLSGTGANGSFLFTDGGYIARVTNPPAMSNSTHIYSGAEIRIIYTGVGINLFSWKGIPIEITYFGLTGSISDIPV